LIEKTLLSKVLAELEARGLLERNPHSTDRRSVALRATTQGLEIAQASEVLGSMLEARLSHALSANERQMLEQLLGKLSSSLLASEAGAPPAQFDKSL
jgi:DNA-binding MarR family transcriptional regulator